MALDLQQRQTQYGDRRDHTSHETENGRVVLQADPIKNGAITGVLINKKAQKSIWAFLIIVKNDRFYYDRSKVKTLL